MRSKTDGIDINIGINLREIRKSNKLTQTEVANYINVTPQQIAKYETGKNRISASTLYRLACYYNKNMNDFLMITIEGLEADWRTK
jgi:transcriptional regulator with XRE-family HTH domain